MGGVSGVAAGAGVGVGATDEQAPSQGQAHFCQLAQYSSPAQSIAGAVSRHARGQKDDRPSSVGSGRTATSDRFYCESATGIGLLPAHRPVAHFFERDARAALGANDMVTMAEHMKAVGAIAELCRPGVCRHQHGLSVARGGRYCKPPGRIAHAGSSNNPGWPPGAALGLRAGGAIVPVASVTATSPSANASDRCATLRATDALVTIRPDASLTIA